MANRQLVLINDYLSNTTGYICQAAVGIGKNALLKASQTTETSTIWLGRMPADPTCGTLPVVLVHSSLPNRNREFNLVARIG
jgi:hypothetical protein